MMKLDGSIFIYDQEKYLISYFNNIYSECSVILIGGLMHNILSLPYTTQLDTFCKENMMALYIPQFRSHPNYGIYTIEDDLEDLTTLINHIKGKIVLIGNSTGCQVIMKYIYKNPSVDHCFLQGPVSDVEYERSINSKLDANLEEARRSSGVLSFTHESNFITAKRYLSLLEPYGNEDLFSSYLSDDFYRQMNPHGVKLTFVISGNDEYAVENIEDKIRLVKNSTIYKIEEGDHFLTNLGHKRRFLEIIKRELNYT